MFTLALYGSTALLMVLFVGIFTALMGMAE